MKTDNMRYIVEVSKYKSINRAAQELFINQQQLSKIIHACETDLGTTVFKRTNKGISLTPDGEEIVEKFKKIIEMYDSLNHHQNAKNSVKGTIRLLTEANIWSGYGLIIRDFANAYPNISISLQNAASTNIASYLKKDNGVGLFFTTKKSYEDLFLTDELVVTPTTKANIVTFASYDSPYIKKYKTISLSTLSKLPLINYKPYNDQPTIMEMIFAQAGLTPNIHYEVSERQVFDDLVKKSGCLFFGLRKPQYIDKDSFGEIRLRDNIECISGIVRNKYDDNPINSLFVDYYTNYYKSKY